MSKIAPKQVHETLARYILADGLHHVFDQEKSHGAYLYDSRTEREYLDLFSFFATQPIGYNHPSLNRPEFREKLGRLAIHRPTLSDVYTPEYAEFADTFARVAGRGHFSHYFFVDGGTLGVENALKAAMDWKVRKNMAAGYGEKGMQIIHFKEAFHGRSGYTLSMTNTNDPNKHQYFAKFTWPRIVNPKLSFPVTDQVLSEVDFLEKKAVADIRQALIQNPHDISALIVEPIQSEGGDNHFRPEFLKQLRMLADEHEFMLIFDEVQTGLGLTGKMWCFEHFDFKPDMVTYGKKAQIAGFGCGSRIDEVRDNVFRVPSRINSTWGGNLIDMIRCTRYLEIIEEEKLVDNAARVGKYFLGKLEAWSKERPRISNPRGRGLLMAFDLPDGEMRGKLQAKVFEHGAVILGCGEKSLRLRPHLTFTRENVDHAMEILKEAEREL